MRLAGETVLVTGAGGFIGSHLAEALVRAGARTRALVHYNARHDRGNLELLAPDVLSQIEVLAGDVCDRDRVRQAVASCGIVFHLAALIGIPYSYLAPQSYVATNVEGTLNVLEACRENGTARLLHTSTSEVYGTPRYTPIDEAHPLNAQSPYAATKIAADQLVLSYYAAFDLPAVVVRPFNTYGPSQSVRAVIPTIVTQALAGGEVRLGNTETVRDFLFVDDTVRAYLAAAQAEDLDGEVVHFGTGTGVTIRQIVEIVGDALGRELPICGQVERRRPPRSEVGRLVCAPKKAETRLGWRGRVELREGLARTIEWFDGHRVPDRTHQYAV
jgi:dTDP-glucose 4,6-dehydratase